MNENCLQGSVRFFYFCCNSSCLCSCAYCQSQYVPWYSTYIYIFIEDLSNTISFLLVHNAQQRAEAPINMNCFNWIPTPLAQALNKCSTGVGLSILKVTWTALQRNLAKWQWKNKCSIVSGCAQNSHILFPFPLHLQGYPWVNTTPSLYIPHENLNFKRYFQFPQHLAIPYLIFWD
jgi:hypothetical protein